MEKIKKLIVFSIDNQRFALYLSAVEKVVQVVEICPLPKMPDYIHGIINLHGEIIPVINTRFLFDMPMNEIELSDQLIIVKTSSRKLALLVNSTHEIIEIKKDEIVKSDNIIYGGKFVQGVIKLEDGMVLINDVDKFLSPEELKQLETQLKALKLNSTKTETPNSKSKI
jgi:purine-binding chemotaxis protein CheW